VNLGPDVFACAGDLVTLLGPLGNGLNYNWSTGASTPLLQFAAEPGTTVLGLEVTDATGCSDSDVMVLTVDDCASGLSDLSSGALATTSWEGALAVPNPFIGKTSVVGVSGEDVALWQLWDAQGRRVDVAWEQLGTEVALSSELPAGMYTLTSPARRDALRLVAQ
ncbi:MAG: T9SS type A sorting domain-containing protein, partial [Flavobacteriales bacterium]